VRCDFEHVHDEFDARLRRFVRSRVWDPESAEDILQDVYLRIHTHIGTLRDCSRLPAWLFQITRNAILDHHRARRPTQELKEEVPQPEEPETDEAMAELARGLAPMIESLPERYRQALSLTLHEGLTQQELARRLGISLSGAKSRVQRARERLKQMLLECCHLEFDRRGRIVGYQERCRCCARSLPGGGVTPAPPAARP